MVICFLWVGHGTASWKKVASSSGESVKSISSSFMALIRSQSVLDSFFVLCALIFYRLSHRYDASNVRSRLSEHDHNDNNTVEHPYPMPTILAIILSVIETNEQWERA